MHNRFQPSIQVGVIENWDEIIDAITEHLRLFNSRHVPENDTPADMHREYKKLTYTINPYLKKSLNDFRGCFLIQSLSLMNLYPLKFFTYATFGKTTGPAKMIDHEFQKRNTKTWYRKPGNRSIMRTSLDKLEVDVKQINERDTPVLLLVFIQFQLKAIGIDMTLDDIENILCKAAGHMLKDQTLQQFLDIITAEDGIMKILEMATSFSKEDDSTDSTENTAKEDDSTEDTPKENDSTNSTENTAKENDSSDSTENTAKENDSTDSTENTTKNTKNAKAELVLYDNHLHKQMNLFRFYPDEGFRKSGVLKMRNFNAMAADATNRVETKAVKMTWTVKTRKKENSEELTYRTISIEGGKMFKKFFQK